MRQWIFPMLTIIVASTTQGEAVKTVRLETPKPSDAVIGNIARVLKRQIDGRCEAKVVSQGDADSTVELAVEPGIGEEGFEVADGGRGTICTLGNDNRGIPHGAGKFLHASLHGKDGFTPTARRAPPPARSSNRPMKSRSRATRKANHPSISGHIKIVAECD